MPPLHPAKGPAGCVDPQPFVNTTSGEACTDHVTDGLKNSVRPVRHFTLETSNR